MEETIKQEQKSLGFPEVKTVVGIDWSDRYIHQYPILKRWLENKFAGWEVKQYFLQNNLHHVVLYAATELTTLFCEDTAGRWNGILYICDKGYAKKKVHCGYSIFGPDRLFEDYRKKLIDKIVICSPVYENEIFDELMEKGILLEDLVSLTEVIYSCRLNCTVPK